MKKLLRILFLSLVATSAVAGTCHTDAKETKQQEYSKNNSDVQRWSEHQSYLEKIDKIR